MQETGRVWGKKLSMSRPDSELMGRSGGTLKFSIPVSKCPSFPETNHH